MTNSRRISSDDAFERLASGRCARPASATSRRKDRDSAVESTPTRREHTVSRTSLPSASPSTPSATQVSRSLLRSVAAAEQQVSPSSQRPVSPAAEGSKLSQRFLQLLEAQNERLQLEVQQLRREQEERDGLAANAEAILLQLQGELEIVLDTTQGSQKDIEDRVMTTNACHKLRRLCKANLSRMKQVLKTAAEASSAYEAHDLSATGRPLAGRTEQQGQAQELAQLTSHMNRQIHALVPTLMRLSVALRTDVLPALRGATPSSKSALLAEFAAATQSCSDVADTSLQLLEQTQERSHQRPSQTSSVALRRKLAASGQQQRRQLAAQARAATLSTTAHWRPQLAGFLQQRTERAEADTRVDSCLESTCRVKAEHALREGLRAAASRAEANEAFVQDLVSAVGSIIEKHRIEDSEAAQAAVEGIGRFLEFAHTAHSRPNESSIKQLVVASQVCSPAIQSAAELLARRGAVPVKAGVEVRSRLDVLKQALDETLSST